jgi:hypothetical protein
LIRKCALTRTISIPNSEIKLILGISGAVPAIYRYFPPLRRRMAAGRGAEGTAYHQAEQKIGQNDPCRCGSGKKYKHCCGKAIVVSCWFRYVRASGCNSMTTKATILTDPWTATRRRPISNSRRRQNRWPKGSRSAALPERHRS